MTVETWTSPEWGPLTALILWSGAERTSLILVEELVDDLDGTSIATQTVRFALDGQGYRNDLTHEHVKAMRKMAGRLAAAGRVPGETTAPTPVLPPRPISAGEVTGHPLREHRMVLRGAPGRWSRTSLILARFVPEWHPDPGQAG